MSVPGPTADASTVDGVVLVRPAGLSEMAGIRTTLRYWLSRHAISGERADQLLVVMSEIVTNAIEASPPQSSIVVSWSMDADEVHMSVEDPGPGFVYEETEPVGPAAVRGRGLTVVEAWTDRLSVTRRAEHTVVATWTRVEGTDR